MTGLTDNFLFDPLLGQPFLRAKREDSHDNLFAPVAIAPSELDVSPLALVVVLCLVKLGCKNAKCPTRGANRAR